MKINMDNSRLVNVTQLKDFLKGSQGFNISLEDAPIAERYTCIEKTFKQFKYLALSKKEKRIVLNYLRKITGYKHTQLFRLFERLQKEGKLLRKQYHRINPTRIYTTSDVKLLEETDELHIRLSEDATREVLRREYETFNHQQFKIISNISHGHITNLRHSPIYKSSWINHTKSRQIPIGMTMPPLNYGKPGSIRVDSVSQKDVYHINSVDEITQWEIVFCVPALSERYMLPILKEIIEEYPFIIFNFHSDRGHETINYMVSDLLQRLLIKQTKSRSYHSGDNALIETKNGSVIRKNMGWEHINQSMCDEINDYYKNFFNPYLNYHRPCGYPTIEVNSKGKKKKVYNNYQVPYEFLKGLPKSKTYLKPGITFDELDKFAYFKSDNEFATIMREEERKLFQKIREADKKDGSQRK